MKGNLVKQLSLSNDSSVRGRLLPLLVLYLSILMLAVACSQSNTTGLTPIPSSNPDFEATITAAVAATVSASSGSPIRVATPVSITPGVRMTEADRIQATITALLATPPVPGLKPPMVFPTEVPTQVPPNPTPTPALRTLSAATVVHPQGPTSAPIISPTITPAPTATLQPTPTAIPEYNCQVATDGTLITAWIDGRQVATDRVAEGKYALLLERPEGGVFADKKVTFDIEGHATDQFAIWAIGGSNELDLSANVVSEPTSSIPSSSPSRHRISGGLLAQLLPPHVFVGSASLCTVP